MEFNFTSKQILDDINNIYDNEEQRRMLYMCIDDVPPVMNKKFAQIEEFLTGTQELQKVSAAIEKCNEELVKLEDVYRKESLKLKNKTQEALNR